MNFFNLFKKNKPDKFENAKKLMDVMVPIKTYINNVKTVENCPYFKPSLIIPSKDEYIMDYPYTSPVNDVISRHIDNDTFIRTWLNNIVQRYSYHLDFTVNKSLINQIDSDNNSGVIIHKTAGYIIPFEYSKVDHIDYISIPNFFDLDNKWLLYFSFFYKYSDGDKYNKNVNIFPATLYPVDIKYLDKFIKFENDQFVNKKKVIYLP